MSFFTVRNEETSKYEEKKSTFIGNIKRVNDEKEAIEFINKLKKKYRDARHNVYAYVIGENMGIQRYTDDGEPQGTAGVPVLDVIKKRGITNTVIVVTRYFGGVLLGTGGLVRAYSKTASLAVDNAKVVEKVNGKALYVQFKYDLLGKIQYICAQNKWYIEDTEYSEDVKIKLYLEVSKIEDIKNQIIENTNDKCEFSEGEETQYFKLENRLFIDNI